MTRLRFSLLSFVLLTLIFSAQTVLAADIGPKPSMEFEFIQDLPNGEISITSGILYECQQADCSDAAPLGELGPQRFTCEESYCNAIAYGFAPYHRIEIQFSDGKTRQSNIFETVAFDSSYRVTVNADDLSVEAISGSPAPSPEPFQDESHSAPNVFIGMIIVSCMGLAFLLAIGLVIFIARRSRTS